MNAYAKFQLMLCAVIFASVTSDATHAGKRKPVGDVNYSSGSSLFIGEEIFYRQWQNGASGDKHTGLGPFYNATSCVACHINNGRGRPPIDGTTDPSFLLRLSIPPQNENQRMALALEKYASVAEPRYGHQLQSKGIEGGEGKVRVEYRDKPYTLDDGEVVVLHRPVYSVDELKYGELHKNVQLSARIAQPLHGIGLLAAIPNDEILTREDPTDKNKDGISGRANLVRDIATGKIVLGRFGWKATQPNLEQQTAAAFAQDIGISSSLFPQSALGCLTNEGPCKTTNSAGGRIAEFPISDVELKSVVKYFSLFVSLRRKHPISSKAGLVGEKLFSDIGCASCHRKSFNGKITLLDGTVQFRSIYPYSDLLLHDMGAALADHRPVAQASGWEWRTQPLWGIGKAEEVNGNKFFLHDGRARSITEAILWHGGEARISREKFAALNNEQRAALVEFVAGL